MKFELKKIRRNTPDDELLSDLKTTATKLGQQFVTRAQQDQFGKFDSSNMSRRLGGWAKAHERAGLRLARHQKSLKASENELLQNLEEVWTRLGRQPNSQDMFAPISRFGVSAYKRHFGSWMKALEKFVSIANFEGALTNGSDEETVVSGSKRRTKREVNWKTRFLVMRRDNFKCKSCGRSPATDAGTILNVDHIKAWANGGETVLDNLQTLCAVCNLGKSNL